MVERRDMLSGRALGYGSVVERRKVAGSIAGTAGECMLLLFSSSLGLTFCLQLYLLHRFEPRDAAEPGHSATAEIAVYS